jgi:hypothetical protein
MRARRTSHDARSLRCGACPFGQSRVHALVARAARLRADPSWSPHDRAPSARAYEPACVARVHAREQTSRACHARDRRRATEPVTPQRSTLRAMNQRTSDPRRPAPRRPRLARFALAPGALARLQATARTESAARPILIAGPEPYGRPGPASGGRARVRRPAPRGAPCHRARGIEVRPRGSPPIFEGPPIVEFPTDTDCARGQSPKPYIESIHSRMFPSPLPRRVRR